VDTLLFNTSYTQDEIIGSKSLDSKEKKEKKDLK